MYFGIRLHRPLLFRKITLGYTSDLSQNKNFKQTDIRNMFFKSQSANDFNIPNVEGPNSIPSQPVFHEEKNTFGSKEIFYELDTYLLIQSNNDVKKCMLCPECLDCSKLCAIVPPASLNWIELDSSVYSSITIDELRIFGKSLEKSDEKEERNEELKENVQFDDSIDFGSLQTPRLTSQKELELEHLIDKSIFGETFDKSFNFEAPKTLDVLLDKYSTSIVDVESNIQIDKSFNFEAPKTLDVLLDKYSTSIVDVESNIQIDKAVGKKMKAEVNNKDVMAFFGLNSLSDLFIEEDINTTQDTIIYSAKSPDLFEGSSVSSSTPDKLEICNSNDDEGSPVLCSFDKSTLERRRQLELSKRNEHGVNRLFSNVKEVDTPSKFTMNRTKMSSTPVNIISNNKEIKYYLKDGNEFNVDIKIPQNSEIISSKSLNDIDNKNLSSQKSVFGIEDLFDFSVMEDIPSNQQNEPKHDSKEHKNSNKSQETLDIDDLFDMTYFTSTKINQLKESDQKNVESNLPLNPNSKQSPQSNRNSNSILNTSPVTNNIKSFTTMNGKSVNNSCDTRSQVSITQMISLVNKDEDGHKSSSQKENVPSLDEIDLFDSIIMSQKPQNSKVSKNTNKIIKTQEMSPNPNVSTKKLSMNLSILSNNSDDEFETKSSSPNWIRAKTGFKTKRNGRNLLPSKQRKRKKLADAFIEKEAELSSNNDSEVSEDEDDSVALDCYEASFVADESHIVSTQMHVKYLQSIRSPNLPGRFKIPRRPQNCFMNVFSQVEAEESQDHLDDSFVVDEEEVNSSNELSQLEILEKKLKEQRKKRKQKKNGNSKPTKRIRIIQIDSDDSS